MESQCQKIIEKLETTYTMSEDFDSFIALDAQAAAAPFIIDVYLDDTEIARTTILSQPDTKTIKILEVVRLQEGNKTHKGIGKDLIYLAACKAAELDYSLELTATPYSESDDLFKYYNSIGLVRKGNIRGQGRNRGLTYVTAPDKLKEIIAKMTGGTKKTYKKRHGVTRRLYKPKST